MNHAENNTSPAAITTNRPQTAAEIIGTAAAEFASDYGRPPHPGETCEEYIAYIKQTRKGNPQPYTPAERAAISNAKEPKEYTAREVEYIICGVLKDCILTAESVISNPQEFVFLSGEIATYADNHPNCWLKKQ